MAKAVAARLQGGDYQIRFFWLYLPLLCLACFSALLLIGREAFHLPANL